MAIGGRRRYRKSADIPDYQKGPCYKCGNRLTYYHNHTKCRLCHDKSIHDEEGLSTEMRGAKEKPETIDFQALLEKVLSYPHFDMPPVPENALPTPDQHAAVVDKSTAAEEEKVRMKRSYEKLYKSRNVPRSTRNLNDPTPEWDLYVKRKEGAPFFDQHPTKSFGVSRSVKKRQAQWRKKMGVRKSKEKWYLCKLITGLPLTWSYTFEFGTVQLFDTRMLDQTQLPSPVVPYRINERNEKEYLECGVPREFCAAVVEKVAVQGGQPIEWTKCQDEGEDEASDQTTAQDRLDEGNGEASDDDVSGEASTDEEEDGPLPTKRRHV